MQATCGILHGMVFESVSKLLHQYSCNSSLLASRTHKLLNSPGSFTGWHLSESLERETQPSHSLIDLLNSLASVGVEFIKSLLGVNGSSHMNLSFFSVGPRERRKRQAPAVTETLKNSIKRQPSVLCVSCQGDLTKEPVFHLPCQHVVCRHCLTVAMQTTGPTACKHCGIPFRQMDVVRVHNV